MHPDASNEVNLPLPHRDYFAPAACGSARYLGSFLKTFTGDSTVAVLAFNQGAGGAKRFVNRFKAKAEKRSYTYAEMERFGAVTGAPKVYVNKFLGIYFLVSDLPRYGYSSDPSQAAEVKPERVFPTEEIVDSRCRAATAPFRKLFLPSKLASANLRER